MCLNIGKREGKRPVGFGQPPGTLLVRIGFHRQPPHPLVKTRRYDKTGTLTKDEMTVRKIFVAGQMLDVSGAGYEPHGRFSRGGLIIEPSGPLKLFLRAAVLASDAHIVHSEANGRWHVKGDPPEGALIAAAAKAGLNKADLDSQSPRVHEIPFTSETKRMTTLHSEPEGVVAYAKGAPEIILD